MQVPIHLGICILSSLWTDSAETCSEVALVIHGDERTASNILSRRRLDPAPPLPSVALIGDGIGYTVLFRR